MSKLRQFLDVGGFKKRDLQLEFDNEQLGGVKPPDDEAGSRVLDAAGDRANELVCKIFLENHTDADLKKESHFCTTEPYVKPPPEKIPAGGTRDFAVRVRRGIRPAVTGFAVYIAEDGLPGTGWSSDYEFTPAQGGQREVTVLKTSTADERFTAQKQQNGLEFRFILNQKPVPPQPQQGFESRIVIENNTSISLTKGPESIEGTVVKGPPDAILPEESAPVVIQSKKTPDGGADFVSFATVWTTGRGNWTITFNHSSNQNQGNATKSLGDNRFIAEEPRVKGKNVKFILNPNPNPPPAQDFVSSVTIMNNTNVKLRKATEPFLSAGKFVKKPDDTIPPRTPIEFTVKSEKSPDDGIERVGGVLTWEPENARKGETWTLSFERASTDKDGRTQQQLDNRTRFDVDPPDATGKNFLFGIRPKGPQQGFVSRVVVRNNTDVALELADSGASPGVIVKKPDSMPAQDAQPFIIQSTKLPDGKDAIRFSANWNTGEGQWLMSFTHVSTEKQGQPFQTLGDTRFLAAPPTVNGKDVEFILNKNPNPPPQKGFVSKLTVVNNTDTVLRQKDPSKPIGTFVKPPPAKIEAKKTEDFSIKSEKDRTDATELVSALVVWEPEGFPRGESWTIVFNRRDTEKDGRPEQDVKSIRFVGGPPDAKGTDCKFTLNQAPEPEFKKPAPTRQPTLRLKDKTTDGWVEYLQEQLNALLEPSPNLKVDGDFGGATLKAVRAFQEKMKKDDPGFMVDGVVGNQTWAALRHGPREEPGTDKRKPHEFKEEGLEARWLTEDPPATFSQSKDQLSLVCVSVGDQTSLEGQNVNIFVTPPGPEAKRKGFVAKIGERIQQSKTGQGDQFKITIDDFRKAFPSDPQNAPVQGYVIEAFFDAELGSDFYNSTKGGFKVVE